MSLLSTNNPPMAHSQKIILSTLSLHKEESKELDSKLLAGIWVLEFLTHQLQVAKTRVQHIKTVTHPIHRIPDEVWWELLLFAVAGSATSHPSIYDMPWFLAQVCHRWRVVAINTGTLWSNIQLYFSRDPLLLKSGSSDSACSILAEHLIRCRSAPRNITINASYLHLQDDPVFKLILKHTVSWCSLQIDMNSINYVFLQACQGFFSSLESLHISDMEFYDSQGTAYDQNALDVFSIVPKMTLLDIPDIPVTQLTLAPAANTSIGHLGISLANQGIAIMHTLQSMTSLSSLDVTCNEAIPYVLYIVDLGSLRCLLLQDPLSKNHIPHLWRKIRMPALTCFALCYEGDDIDQPIYPTLLTPHTSITDFCIYLESDEQDAELYESALVAILYNLPNVTILELESTNLWPIVVEELYEHVELLPHLARLCYLVDTPLKDGAADVFVRMLQCRKNAPSCARISHLSVITYPIMNQSTEHIWDSILNDEIQPMEVFHIHNHLYSSRAFLTEVN